MANKMRVYSYSIRKILVQIQLLLLFFPNVQLLSISTEKGTIPGSLCYFFSILLIPYLLFNIRRLIVPKWYIIGLPVFAIANSIIHIHQYGLAKGILHWMFGLYLLVMIVNVGKDFSKEEWRCILERAACIFVIAHIVLQICNMETIIWLLRGYFDGSLNGWCGCYLPSITRGGRNLDCSWLALFGVFVQGKKRKWYQGYTFAFSMLSSSRSGIVASVILIIYSIWENKRNGKGYYGIKKCSGVILVWTVCLLCTGILQANVNRSSTYISAPADTIHTIFPQIDFGEKGFTPEVTDAVNDNASSESSDNGVVKTVLSGRKAIWEKVPKMFWDNPWGYGAGNAMSVMKRSYGFDSFEDVVHNIFMQWLLDEGITGGLWFIGLAILYLRRQWKNWKTKTLTAYDVFFTCYLLLGLVEFHGAEALMFFVLGVYMLQLEKTVKLGEKRG